MPEGHAKQAEYELDIICKLGFPGYFLVTADLVDHAKREGIWVGPWVGLGMLFERFLNPPR